MKNIILTGIERSGSSYTVDVLNNYSNVVFLNEPPLEYLPSQPERILEYFEQYRRRILSGSPVQGVFKAGTDELAWDTLGSVRGQVESRSYTAHIDDEEFIMGFKSLTPMLRHTYYFRQFKSLEIMFIAIVRHPVDTIFSQLQHGGANLPVIPNADPKITEITKKIALMRNPIKRAAYVWRFNTSIILDNLDMYRIIRYKTVCHAPEIVSEFMYDRLEPGQKLRRIPKSESIQHKDEFSVEGRALIAKICRTNAIELGVWD
jgi:hypothetical protein